VHVAISLGALYLRSWKAEFDHMQIDQLKAFDQHSGLVKDACNNLIGNAVLDDFKSLLVPAKNVNRQPERTSILATNFGDKVVKSSQVHEPPVERRPWDHLDAEHDSEQIRKSVLCASQVGKTGRRMSAIPRSPSVDDAAYRG